ncbi:HlyD family secretion protein [Pseudomonas sp. PB120]|uniref:HlyD family secretion protein n=1 Tax=Pseudomonas sp. PB120 TaxID=2494700 RepID=UPI0012FDFB4D|nr:HlyD family secretion protein [Pseudomonas sp. PB120]MVV46664.1 HlyD family secretion protein [Pseudomonas sp. PB120]
MTAILAVDETALATPPQRTRKRQWVWLAGSTAVIGLVLWGAHWWTTGRFIESTNDAYLQADSMAAVPRVGGSVVEVYVTDNQTVSVGQRLVRIDSRTFQAAQDQSAAALAARKADITRGEAELAQQRADIVQAQAQLQGEIANQAYAAAQIKRYEPLTRTGAETEERMEQLRNSWQQATTSRNARAAQVQVAERRLATLQATLQQARAQFEGADAKQRQSQLDLQDTIVRSSLAGRVADRSVRVGQYVQPGTRLMTVVPLDQLYITANFKETQIGAMRPGQSVSIRVDALPGVVLHGSVDSLAPGTGSQFALLPPQNATGNFTKIVQRVPVRIQLQADPQWRDSLMPGLSLTVEVDTRD